MIQMLPILAQTEIKRPDGIITMAILLGIVAVVVLLLYVSRFRKCPSDRVLVVFGKTGEGASKCIHGGATFVWPVIQDYGFLSLRPLQIEVNLGNALCNQNIRINVPSVFTVAISTDPVVLKTAAERLLGQSPDAISGLAKDIIFGQLRLVVASLTIEEINSDRENFLREIERNLTPELGKIGLQLINVNITDIADESGYIDAIGKRAAAGAIQQARIEVADAERKGGIGQADANKEQRVKVAQLETMAQTGEAEAEKDRRVAIKQADAAAIAGENQSAIEIAKSNAERQEQEAEAYRRAEAARRVASAMVEKAQYQADEQAQLAKAQLEIAKQRADIVVSAEIEKQKVEIYAEAQAEKLRREARGQADATFAKFEAEARGNYEVLKAKAEGFNRIITACGGDTNAVSKLLLIEKLEEIVKLQTAAISGIKIDKVTVWDSGNGTDGKGSTANFLSGMVKSLPALHDVSKMAGLDLPQFLGKVEEFNNGIPEVTTQEVATPKASASK